MTVASLSPGHATVAAKASATILAVMKSGQSKHGETWRTRADQTDLAHAKRHLKLLQAGDQSEDHLAHCLCRLALVLARQKKNQ